MAFFQFVSPKEGKEGKRIVKTPLTIQTKASMLDIRKSLDSRVRVDADASSIAIFN